MSLSLMAKSQEATLSQDGQKIKQMDIKKFLRHTYCVALPFC